MASGFKWIEWLVYNVVIPIKKWLKLEDTAYGGYVSNFWPRLKINYGHKHLIHSSSNSTCRFQSMRLGNVGKCVHRVPSSMQHVRRQSNSVPPTWSVALCHRSIHMYYIINLGLVKCVQIWFRALVSMMKND